MTEEKDKIIRTKITSVSTDEAIFLHNKALSMVCALNRNDFDYFKTVLSHKLDTVGGTGYRYYIIYHLMDEGKQYFVKFTWVSKVFETGPTYMSLVDSKEVTISLTQERVN